MTARLITIAVSHFCEKARWALDRQGVAYVEEQHLPMLHWPHAKRAGGGRTVPILVDDGRVFPQSWDIVLHADARRGDRAPLVPADVAAEVAALSQRFDDELGPHSRRFAYAAVLPHKQLALSIVRGAAPAWERALANAGYPFVVKMLRRGLKIDDAGVERSRAKIERTFAFVEEQLRDGRRYLLGDRFTAADLTFAALAAPLVLPAEYHVRFPPLSALSQPYRDEMAAYQARPAGVHALRLYREERRAALVARAAA